MKLQGNLVAVLLMMQILPQAGVDKATCLIKVQEHVLALLLVYCLQLVKQQEKMVPRSQCTPTLLHSCINERPVFSSFNFQLQQFPFCKVLERENSSLMLSISIVKNYAENPFSLLFLY